MATEEPGKSASSQRIIAPTDWTSASIAELIAHITTIHHARSRLLLRQAESLACQLAMSREASGLPFLLSTFRGFERDMLAHLEHEETVLFPACLALDRASHPGNIPKGVIDVSHAIREMSTGHGSAHQDIMRILGLSQDLAAQDAHAAIAPFRQSLIDLEEDMIEHGRLEEEILLPAAIFQQELSQTRQATSVPLRPLGTEP